MLAENPLKLVMEFHRKSGRYVVKNKDGRQILFPKAIKIKEIWHNIFPSTTFFVGSGISMPVTGFYAEVSPGTKAKDRQRFCDALAIECKSI